MKILIVAQNLEMGGIQKSLIHLVNELHKRGQYKIDIFTFCGGELRKELPCDIQVRYAKKPLELISTPFQVVKQQGRVRWVGVRIFLMLLARVIGSNNLYKLLFRFEETENHYDIAISYFNDVSTGYFNKGTNLFVDRNVNAKKKISWLHTDPIEAGFIAETCRKGYKCFDKIVCVSNAVKEKFDAFLPEYKNKTSVVYNLFPIEVILDQAKSSEHFNNHLINIVSVGRIDNITKNFDKIPYICKYLKENGVTHFKWRVIGSGPDFEDNTQLIKELHVSDVVEFVGHQHNPYPYMKLSDLYVMTSKYEGFPMVISESLILGVPVVTTRYAAAHEQIQSGQNGIISENGVEGVQKIIYELLMNPSAIQDMKMYLSNNHYSNHTALEQLEKELRI